MSEFIPKIRERKAPHIPDTKPCIYCATDTENVGTQVCTSCVDLVAHMATFSPSVVRKLAKDFLCPQYLEETNKENNR